MSPFIRSDQKTDRACSTGPVPGAHGQIKFGEHITVNVQKLHKRKKNTRSRIITCNIASSSTSTRVQITRALSRQHQQQQQLLAASTESGNTEHNH